MATANAEHRRTKRRTVVSKSTTAEAVQQLWNILRVNGWVGEESEIIPGRRIEHGSFSYWVDSTEGR